MFEEVLYLLLNVALPPIERWRVEAAEDAAPRVKRLCQESSRKEHLTQESFFDLGIASSSNVSKTKIKVAVYLWWKSRDWIVRDGLKFGVDFLLYDRPEDEVHARYF